MSPLLVFLWISLALYLAVSLVFARALRPRAPASDAPRPFVTVVVAARNEERNLPHLLADLRAQTYDDFEVVVVDDRSTDGTAALVEAAAREAPGRFRLVRQSVVPEGLSPKKLALQRGVEAGRGDVLLLTDADCRVRPGWVEGMARAFAPGVAMVLGYSELDPGQEGSLFERVQAFEFLTLVTTMAASANVGVPLGASGHNLAYRRDAFERVGGYAAGMDRVAGDDMLMLHQIRAAPDTGRIVYADAPDTRNRTYPEPSLRRFRNQRARWASSGMHHLRLDPRIFAFATASLVANLVVLVGPFAVAADNLDGGHWAALVTTKLAADLLLFGTACARFGRLELLRYLPLWFVAQPVYLTAMAVWGQRSRFSWKP